jgi:Concanavalin A-like lectin/glucanases superfamily
MRPDHRHHLAPRRALAAAAASILAALAFVPPAPAAGVFPAGSYPAQVLADGASSYWRLDGTNNSYAADQTGKLPLYGPYSTWVGWGRQGALRDGDADTSLELPGASTYPELFSLVSYDAPAYTFSGRKPFTLEAWIRPERLNSVTRRVFSGEWAASNTLLGVDGGYLVGVRSDGLVFSRYAADHWTTLKAPVSPGYWYHFAGTYDGQMMRLYLNGQLMAAHTSTISIPEWRSVRFALGAKQGMYRFYAGGLDEAAVYAHPLSASQIAAHFRIARPAGCPSAGCS